MSQDIRVAPASGVATSLKASANLPPALVPAARVADAIVQQARSGDKRFEIRLDPPEMGRIEVRLEFTSERHVAAHITVERSETLDLMQREARALERTLSQAGFDGGGGSVTFSLKDQGSQRGRAEPFPYPDAVTPKTSPEPEPGPSPIRARTQGALDIRI